MFIFIFIYLFFSIEIITILSEPIILQFSTRKYNDKNIMKNLINNDIYTYLYVGSNKQKIEMNIKSQKSSTFVLSESCPDNTKANKFNELNSVTYNATFIRKPYYSYEFKEATLSTDDFLLIQNNNKQIEIKDFTFMLANTMMNNYQEYMGGLIGLKLLTKDDEELNMPEKSSFINQLKEKNIINSYVFALIYDDEFNGKLYVGDYFHSFNKSFSENDFFAMKAGNEKFKVKNWEINIEKMISGNNIVQKKTSLEIYYELGIIAASDSYRDYINNTFFKNYILNGLCHEKINFENIATFKKYTYIECDKKYFDINSFPKLSFFNSEIDMNFTLSPEELFYEYENKIYFLVIFPIYGIAVDYWLMGKIFVKKYNLFLDKDKRIIGLYKNYTKIEEEKELEITNNANYTGYIVAIVILGLVLITTIISFLYYFLVIKKSRRIRANELDDNIDYIAQEKNEEENNKFIIN